jgi:hypothetical protein
MINKPTLFALINNKNIETYNMAGGRNTGGTKKDRTSAGKNKGKYST